MSRAEPPTMHLPDLSSHSPLSLPMLWETMLDDDGGIILALVSGTGRDRVVLATTTHPTVEDAEHAAIRIWRNYRAVNRRNPDA